MCLSKAPTIIAPPAAAAAAAPMAPAQEAKQPQAAQSAVGGTADPRKRMTAAGAPDGTLLTGPSGIENSQLNLGKSTLLGG